MSLVSLATCNLNQWALDFEGNRDRILESIMLAKQQGAQFRTGPELEIPGYGCLDHFLEIDTYIHSWEVLKDILLDESSWGIIVDVGMPVVHKGVRYNCRLICSNGKILLIRPKLWLANDGNYREMRYFSPWEPRRVDEFVLPNIIREATNQRKVPFGDAKIVTSETSIGFETCEELFTPHSPHIDLALDGVEIFTNSSGSHHELRKLDTRLNLIAQATRRCGGVYLYANQRGCDGDRLYYDGSALIVVNGQVIAQGSQFSLKDVEVISATVDLNVVRAYRSAPSFGLQAGVMGKAYTPIEVHDTALESAQYGLAVAPTPAIHPFIHEPEDEIALGPACWLWDYLRRSRCAGYFVPLSGGIDSCSTALIVFSMCRLVVSEAAKGNAEVIVDARRLAGQEEPWIPTDPREFCNRIFHTCYMGTENSSQETRDRARELAEQIGSYHIDLNMDMPVNAIVTLTASVLKRRPQFKVHGGSPRENLALQNVQARLRMVVAYTFSLLLPWIRDIPGGLLVLGSANVDESLRGYLTKYDASSADINPIGSISKMDLKRFVRWAIDAFNLPILEEFVDATPTAELEPITETYVQSDEADMGLTYEELSVFGRLRKVYKLGPWSMFTRLSHEWAHNMALGDVAVKIKRFFYYYAINRHKITTLTPAYHAEQYSPDDNRFDLRPFMIRPFPWAFAKIDEAVKANQAEEDELMQSVD